MRINKNNVAGLVIDVQERLYPFIHDHERLTQSIRILIEGLKILEVPIFITEQYVKGLGPTIPAIAEVIAGIPRCEKSTFSCCDEPRFILELANSGKDFVIVCGIESHVCVMQTVIDLRRHGYTPVVVTDCISSRKEEDKRVALERMKQEGAILSTCESILFELLRHSGGDTFKAISRLVK